MTMDFLSHVILLVGLLAISILITAKEGRIVKCDGEYNQLYILLSMIG